MEGGGEKLGREGVINIETRESGGPITSPKGLTRLAGVWSGVWFISSADLKLNLTNQPPSLLKPLAFDPFSVQSLNFTMRWRNLLVDRILGKGDGTGLLKKNKQHAG